MALHPRTMWPCPWPHLVTSWALHLVTTCALHRALPGSAPECGLAWFLTWGPHGRNKAQTTSDIHINQNYAIIYLKTTPTTQIQGNSAPHPGMDTHSNPGIVQQSRLAIVKHHHWPQPGNLIDRNSAKCIDIDCMLAPEHVPLTPATETHQNFPHAHCRPRLRHRPRVCAAALESAWFSSACK